MGGTCIKRGLVIFRARPVNTVVMFQSILFPPSMRRRTASFHWRIVRSFTVILSNENHFPCLDIFTCNQLVEIDPTRVICCFPLYRFIPRFFNCIFVHRTSVFIRSGYAYEVLRYFSHLAIEYPSDMVQPKSRDRVPSEVVSE
jgi:hypothetical protein